MVLDNVKKVISEKLDVDADQIDMSTDLMRELEADSLDAVEIIMAIEDVYKVEVPNEVLEDFNTVGDIVTYIEEVR